MNSKIRIFIGFKWCTEFKVRTAITLRFNDEIVQVPPYYIENDQKRITKYFASLLVVNKVLDMFKDCSGKTMWFYGLDDDFCYEWGEYSKTKQMSDYAKRMMNKETMVLWQAIVSRVEKDNISIKTYEKDNLLTAIGNFTYHDDKSMDIDALYKALMYEIAETEISVNSIPTKSAHGRVVKKILNDILQDNPEYYSTISNLVLYPVQKWAESTRRKLDLDYNSVKQALDNGENYFGLWNVKMKKQLEALHESTNMLEIFDEAVSLVDLCDKPQIAVNTIHDFDAPDESKYFIQTYYKDGVLRICKEYNDIVNNLHTLSMAQLNDLSEDETLVFRNGSDLVNLIPKIFWRDKHEETVEILGKCFDAIGTYPLNGAEISKIMFLYCKGWTIRKIAKEIKMSTFYVERKYKEGVELLSLLIWGVGDRNLILSAKKV